MQQPQWSFLSKDGKQVTQDLVLGISINSLWENYATTVAFLLSNYNLNILYKYIYTCTYIKNILYKTHRHSTPCIHTQLQFPNMHAGMQFEPGCMCLSSFCHPVTLNIIQKILKKYIQNIWKKYFQIKLRIIKSETLQDVILLQYFTAF